MSKSELTLQELELQYKKLGEQIEKRKKDEEERKKADLALEKEKRKKELDDARAHYSDLFSKYIQDYGTHTINDDNYEFFPFDYVFSLFRR